MHLFFVPNAWTIHGLYQTSKIMIHADFGHLLYDVTIKTAHAKSNAQFFPLLTVWPMEGASSVLAISYYESNEISKMK